MGRKSSLSEKEWIQIGDRLLAGGESARALAREFGTSEASVRRKFPAQRKDVKIVANQLVAAEAALRSLPISSQIDALNLVDQMKSMSTHLGGAGAFGAMTAHRLAGIAQAKALEIDDAAPLTEQSMEALKSIAYLSRTANEAGEIAMGILKANKETITELNRKPPAEDKTASMPPVLSREEWLTAHGIGQ